MTQSGLHAGGNTITVNNLTDPASTSGNGFCTLREAINNANAKSDTSGGDCAAGTGTDDIVFSVSGTITLTSALPAIANSSPGSLTIDGAGQSVTVDGASTYRVLLVNAGAALALNDLTIAHGNAVAGGGLYNYGALSVTGCTLSANSSGQDTNVGNGAAIYDDSDSTLTVTNSTFSNNTAAALFSRGGGIYNNTGATATVTDSTFVGNTTGDQGGGGGIANGGQLYVTNSTFSANSSGGSSAGSAILNFGTATISSSTVSGNGYHYGLFADGGSFTVTNSILSDNVSGNCGLNSAFTNGGYNISDDATCGFGNANGASGQTIGDKIAPKLSPMGLQNNDGPTQTIALLSNSPAIAATPLADCPATDQRGAPRPAPGQSACDVGAYESSSTVWSMFHHDAAHTGLSTVDTIGNTGALRWKFTTGNFVSSAPALGADGTIYFGSYDHSFYALEPGGAQKWKFTTGDIIRSSPAVTVDGTIYFGSADHNLYALNPNGSLKWSFAADGSIDSSSPVVGSDGTIYVGSLDNNLYAVNPDGTLKWIFTTGGSIYSSPALGSDGTIYVGSDDDNLYAINPDGSEKWAFATGDQIVEASPTLGSDGTIYVGSDDDNLYAINPDGTEKWAFAASGLITNTPAIGADGTLYVGSNDHNFYAVNPDGTQKWSFTTGFNVNSSAAIGSDGTIYFGSEDTYLYALNPDGSLRWKFSVGGAVDVNVINSCPAIGADGTIYFGSNDNNLYALNGPTTTISVAASLIFPSAPAGSTVTKNLTIKNSGRKPLYIGSVSSFDPEFAPTGATSCPTSGLGAGLSCTITIGFTPTAIGPRAATLTITDNAGTGSQHVALSGTGTADVTTAVTAVTWPDVKFGSPVVRSITVTNHQATSVSVGESFSGPNAPDFSLSGGTCGSSIGPKTACTIVVKFTPGALGSESASIAIATSPDIASPHMVSLNVPGTIPATVAPASLAFGSLLPTDLKAKTVTVTNHSPFALTLSDSIGGTDPADFMILGGCGSTLAADSFCTVAVAFAPVDVGALSASLTINIAQDPTSPHKVALTGTGL